MRRDRELASTDEDEVLLMRMSTATITGYEEGWKLRDHYVRGTYAVLGAGGHAAHLERPDLIAAAVNDWLGTSASAW